MTHQPKAMLIGVDGLPPPLLERLGESLPTIGRLMEEGSWGPLRSTIPYTTAPAWTSMVTGVDPGRHGIYDFLHLDWGHNLRVARGSDCRATPLWRRLHQWGLRSIVVNVPPFYPAEAVDSAMIGSFPHRNLSVYPPSLRDHVRRMGYIIDVDDIAEKMRRSRVKALMELLRAEERRIRVAEYLLDHMPWNLSIIVLNFADRLLHNLPISTVEEALMDEGGSTLLNRLIFRGRWRIRRLIEEMFRILDEFLSRCLRRVGEELLIVASIHGMTERPRALLINGWLREMGYINYEETKALSYSTVMPLGLIRLNLEGRERGGVVPRGSHEELLNEIEGGLRDIRDMETGERVIKRIWRGERLYGPEAEGYPPDLIFEVEDGYTVDPWRLEEGVVAEASRPNDHERCGAFLIHGWEKHRGELEIGEIHDIILSHLGLNP